MAHTIHHTENSAFSELDRHFALPAIQRVELGRPLVWLRLGWRDMQNNLPVSLIYGLAFAVAGFVILTFAADRPYLFTAAISGFFLVAPLLAAGLYEISRRQERGTPTNFLESLHGWRRNGESMAYFGFLLAFVAISWERISAILFALFYGGEAPDLQAFFGDVFMSGNYWRFVVAYVAVGAVLAAAVFALSAISVPMLLDRDVDIGTAMAASLKAVGQNIAPMALWAALIVALTALGFATLLLGLIVVLPVLGHAAWHAYKDLVRW